MGPSPDLLIRNLQVTLVPPEADWQDWFCLREKTGFRACQFLAMWSWQICLTCTKSKFLLCNYSSIELWGSHEQLHKDLSIVLSAHSSCLITGKMLFFNCKKPAMFNCSIPYSCFFNQIFLHFFKKYASLFNTYLSH